MRDTKDEIIDDNALVAAVAAGDTGAFGSLYNRHASRLLGVAIAILKSRREAEDLLHDVFMELWQRAGSYDSAKGTVDYWLVLRLRSRALDRLRALKNKRSYELKAGLEPTQCSSNGEELELFEVSEAIGGLSAQQQQVLNLSYMQGYSCSEISRLTDIPVGTIKSRLQSALKKMRQHFEIAQGAST